MRLHRSLLILALAAGLPACGGGGGGGGGAAPTPVLLVSESLAGVDGDGNSDQQVMSADGRYIAFRSAATNLLGTVENAQTDIFRKDMVTGEVIRVSRTAAGLEPNAASRSPSISPDGQYIAYVSAATDIAGTATGTYTNVYLYVHNGGVSPTTVLISNIFSSATTEATGNSDYPCVSVSGATVYVAFESVAQDLITGLTYPAAVANVYRKTNGGAMALVSRDVTTATTAGDGASTRPSMSEDGTLVAFQSAATNLITAATDTNGLIDVFVRDMGAGTTRVSVSAAGAQLTGGGSSTTPQISGDGTDVTFVVTGTNIDPADLSPNDIYIRSDWAGAAATSKVSFHQALGTSGASCTNPAINQDGTQVVWHSATPVLVNGDTNGQPDVFRRNLTANTLDRVSLSSGGAELTGAPTPATAIFYRPAISSNGTFIAFDSTSTNVITPAPSAFRHVYRRG